jgi:hypothetical protein
VARCTNCESHVSRRMSAPNVSSVACSVNIVLEPLIGSMMIGSIRIIEENNSGWVKAANVLQKMALDRLIPRCFVNIRSTSSIRVTNSDKCAISKPVTFPVL